MKLLNIAKCKFIITDSNLNKINVEAGSVIDVDDKTANNLLKSYPNSWKNLEIVINKVEKKEAEKEEKVQVEEAPKVVKNKRK